jgi:hypothetical protein
MLEERGAQSDAEPVLRRTEAVTAVPDTTVPETAVPETATRERAPAASPGKPLPAPQSEWAITGVIENVELVVQRSHEPLAYVQCSSRSWDAASRIGEHPDISVREWRPSQLRLTSPHPDRNKAFRQAVVALGHSMA